MDARAIRRLARVLVAALGWAIPLHAFSGVAPTESYASLPMTFELNEGQTHADVRFLARGSGYGVYLTADDALLVLSPTPSPRSPSTQSSLLRIALVGAHPAAISGHDELPGKANYLIGEPASWRTGIRTYAKVHYRGVYPGIDVVYHGRQDRLEYDFVVAPGGDPRRIAVRFDGAQHIEIDPQGDLVLHTAAGPIRQPRPVVYQELAGLRREIGASYVLATQQHVGFEVAAYDHSEPLIIDPLVVSYATYLGGADNDYGNGIAVDAEGNVYTTGLAASVDFPTTPGALRPTFGGAGDAFVAKLDPSGTLVYSTYLGGTGHEHGEQVVVDAAGSVYVTGHTRSLDFPTTPGALQAGAGGLDDAFVAKLNATGTDLEYSSYLGGSAIDFGLGIAADGDGHAHVTGYTESVNFPVVAAMQPTSRGANDAFVAKLNTTGTAAVYSTYLGGAREDYGRGIALDANANAYVAGSTDSFDFPTTPGVYRRTFAGGWDDPFVTKLNAAGGLVFSTYLGGSRDDRASGIAVDASGRAYVVGTTLSLDFATTPGAFQRTYGGGAYDGYVLKLNTTGATLLYATYLGGSELDYGQGIVLDDGGNAYVTGTTYSTNFPTTLGAFQRALRGTSDAFVTQLGASAADLVHSSYLGGAGDDWGANIARHVAASPHLHVAGYTSSTDLATAGAAQPAYGGGPRDGFVASIRVDEHAPSGSTPFAGEPFTLPGGFQAADFDLGGEGIAYHDNVPGNAGGVYRGDEDVDIVVSASYVVNNFETGEWLRYTVDVQADGLYDIELRAASAFDGSAFHVEVDGHNVSGPVVVPNTGSWIAFTWVPTKTVALTAGRHELAIVVERQYFDLASVRVVPAVASFDDGAVTYTGFWGTYGAETGTFRGGSVRASNQGAATATFSFTGTAVTWVGTRCNVCGTAAVSIDGGVPATVDTFGPRSPGALVSEPVFSAAGLDPGRPHTLSITVPGTGYVAVDGFDVTR